MRSGTTLTLALALGLLGSAGWSVAAKAAMAPQAVADALLATMTKPTAKASFDSVAAAGNDVLLSGFKIVDDDGSIGSIGSMLVINPVARPTGGFTADRMTIDKGRIKTEDSVIAWQSGSVSGVTVPSPDEIKAKTSILPFSKLSMGGLVVESADLRQPMEMAGLSVALGAIDKGIPHDVQASLSGIKVPAVVFGDEPGVQETLKSLGYDGFTLSFGVDGLYDQAGDTLTFRSITLDIEQVGKFTVTAKLSDIPLAKLGDDAQRDDVMDNAKIGALTIRFDNTGIVDRILDTQAKATGMSRSDLVDQTAGALPFLLTLASVGNDAFQAKLASEATLFLKAPKSFVISAAPAQPLGLLDLIGVAGGDTQAAVDALMLDVAANK